MKLSDLESKHLDKECVVITCGPSLREFEMEQVLKFCSDKIVICVKEAILEYGEIADYFFSNFIRLRDYNLREFKSINIYQSNSFNENKFIDQYDIILKEDRPYHVNNQLLKLKNFEKYDILNNQLRPWGPGILYESVFYFCKYIGCKKVYTLGWDLIDIKKHKTIVHYFDKETTNKYKNSKRWDASLDRYVKEMKFVNENIPYMYNYFKNKGMDINILGEQSYVNKTIPRVSI